MFTMHQAPHALFAPDKNPPFSLTSLPEPLKPAGLAEVCALLEIDPCRSALGQAAPVQFNRRRLRAGATLYRSGSACRNLYVLSSGFMKSTARDPDGVERVVGFSMRGSLLGMDGAAYHRHTSNAIALVDADLIVLPLAAIHKLGRTCPEFTLGLYGAMSAELARLRPATRRLGLTTRGRIGRLLLDVADRFAAMGYSPNRFNLPMGRADIASYLGMAQETVSRSLMELEQLGLIRHDQRAIHILDREGLRRLKRRPRRALLRYN